MYLHHLFNGLSGLSIEVGQLTVLRLHLLRIDLWIALHHTLPPLHSIVLLQGKDDLIVIQCPIAVVDDNALVECSVDDWRLALNTDLQITQADRNDGRNKLQSKDREDRAIELRTNMVCGHLEYSRGKAQVVTARLQ